MQIFSIETVNFQIRIEHGKLLFANKHRCQVSNLRVDSPVKTIHNESVSPGQDPTFSIVTGEWNVWDEDKVVTFQLR